MLKAGAGKAAIHFPDALFPLEGFCGVHDEPHARILLLEPDLTAKQRVVVVALELVMLPEPMLEDLKERICGMTGAVSENIWIHVTHAITTPHAPGGPAIGPGGPAMDPAGQAVPSPEDLLTVLRHNSNGRDVNKHERVQNKYSLYEIAVQTAVLAAARQAVEMLVEVRVGIGQGDCDINCNRDIQTPYGWWIGNHGNGLSNKQLSVIKFETEGGRTVACVISYGLKPCAIDNSWMNENKRQVSSDIPGRACGLMEEALNAPVLFLMSAAGDQIPKKQAWYDEVLADGTVRTVDLGVDKGLLMVEELGNIMAQAALKVVHPMECSTEISRMEILKTTINWPAKERMNMHPRKAAEFVADGRMAAVPVGLLILGPIAFVATKPEVNCITELELKQLSPFKYTFLVTMVNGGMKYMPDRQSYDHVTWEAMASMLMPGAAEAFVQTAGKLLKQRAGHRFPMEIHDK